MSEQIRAIIAQDVNGKTKGVLQHIGVDHLPDEDVLVAVAYSTLNYKDGLAVSGKGKICRSLPMVCGIDLAGTVIESRDRAWKTGDQVLVNGYGLSEKYWGGYAQKARLKPEWLVRVPAAISLEQAMAVGTAGYTAMLCVHAIQDHGIKPGDGAVLVTGAAGGVGSVAVMLLATLGYQVVASTGRVETTGDFLKSLGASGLLDRAELARDAKPLEAEKWAAVVDTVGAQVLATALAQTCHEGIVTACGLVGGTGLPTTVMPFILRGVTLRGIDSAMATSARRQRAWDALARLINAETLASIYEVRPLSDVPRLADEIVAGRIRGRVVIDVNAE